MFANRLPGVWLLASLLLVSPLRGQNSIAVTCPGQAAAGGAVSCSLALTLGSGAAVGSLTFGLAVTPHAQAPSLSQGQLSFTDLIGGAFTATGGTNNAISVFWANLSPTLTANTNLGSIAFTLPSTAVGAQAYSVAITGASASLSSSVVQLSVAGPAAITVNPGMGTTGQTINFPPIGNVSVTAQPFAISATASSGLSVGFASTTTTVCTVAGSTVTILGVGTCSITASQAGNATYAAATPVVQSFLITPSSRVSEPGVFRQNFAFFLNKTGSDVFNSPGDLIYYNFVAPQAGDKPVVGDWTGSGTTKIGIFRSGTWFLDLNGDGVFTPGVDAQFSFGQAGDTPVVGDWTGNGKSKIGIVRPFAAGGPPALWVLDYDGNGTMSANDLSKAFAYGGVAGDVPIVGDWTGNGITKVGVVRPFALGGVPAFWLLDANNDHAIDTGDLIFAFGGIQGDIQIAGDWNGSGTSKVGVVRPFSPGTPAAFWLLDGNGSAPTVPGSNDLVYFPFGGIAGDVPVVGKW